jgi:hypothetical protein
MLARWGAEHPPVLSAEVGWALVPDAKRRLGRVEALAEHQLAGLLETQTLLVLERTHSRHAFEVQVKRRRTHLHPLCKKLNPEWVRVVIFQPADCRRDPLGGSAGRCNLAQPTPLWTGENAVRDLAENERSQGHDVLRRSQERDEARDGVKQQGISRCHRDRPHGSPERRNGRAVCK